MRFFHLHASYRKKKKLITKLQIANGMAITHEEKAEELLRHFTSIMGTEAARSTMINLIEIRMPVATLAHLDQLFTKPELWETINPCLPTKHRVLTASLLNSTDPHELSSNRIFSSQ